MKRIGTYLLLFGIVFLFYALFWFIAPKKINWNLSFDPNDKSPYGTYVLRKSLEDLFPNQIIQNYSKNYYFLNQTDTNTLRTLLIINNQSSVDQSSINELLEFVERGNTVFYASHNLNQYLLDTLGLEMEFDSYNQMSPAYFALDLNSRQYELPDSVHFRYSYGKYFVESDTIKFPHQSIGFIHSHTDFMGAYIQTNQENSFANFMVFQIGKGKLFLHSSPLAFTNFNILKSYTARYTEDICSYLPDNQVVLWDQTMLKQGQQEQSIFGVILRYPSIRLAYFVSLLLVILYVLTNVFRRHRAIPILKPKRNASLELVEKVSDLYIQQANHKNLSDKLIRHFMDYLQQQYYINTNQLDDHFVEKLSRKSGKSIGDIKAFVAEIKKTRAVQQLRSVDLMHLYQVINDFKTKK
jgi:hypothetical protein